MRTFCIFILLIVSTVHSYAQTEKIFVQTLAIAENTIIIDLKEKFELRITKGRVIRAETSVSLKRGSSSLLDAFGRQGKYRLQIENGKKGMRLVRPASSQISSINNNTIQEEVSFVLYIPEGFMVFIENEGNLVACR